MVGSSSTRRFEARANSRESRSRERSPPERVDGGVGVGGIEQKLLEIADDVLLLAAHVDPVAAVREDIAHALAGFEELLLIDGDAPASVFACFTVPVSGAISPVRSPAASSFRRRSGRRCHVVAALDAEREVFDDRAAVVGFC